MLNINRVVLYKTGLGYFVRKGKVDMSKAKKLQLSFKTNVMNDILKTLSIICSKGMVTGASYEAADVDTARALEDALIRVPEVDSFLSLVKQLIGTQITVTIGSRTLHGKVLGVQEIKEGSKEKAHLEPYLVIVTDDGKITNLHVKEITSFEIDDQKMNKELNFFLETIYLGKKKDTKTFTIFFEGTDEADVFITYLQAMPSWKTSYRLICSHENEYLIQGWALVDNILDEDWEEIDLSLISGLPISFIYDLYSPNWISRPEIARIDSFDLTPPEFEEAYIADKEFEMAPPAPKMAAEPMISPSTISVLAKMPRDYVSTGGAIKKSTKVSAKGEAAGMAGFEYHILTPVTVKRNQSSLVPILQSEIEVKKLCVYNKQNHKTNPMQCLELINTTDLTLESGPISIFDHDAFAGEAMLPFLKEKEKRLVAYAVELGIHVNSENESKTTNIHEIKIGQYAETFQYLIDTTIYTIKNKTTDEKTLIIEHPKQYGYELFETRPPEDETDNYYRYTLKIAPMHTNTFDIKMRRVEMRRMKLNQISQKVITNWFALKLISVEKRDFLLKILDLEVQKSTIEQEINTINQSLAKIVEDQNRLRENIKSLGDSQSEARLKDKYVNTLETQEETLEHQRKTIEELMNKKKELDDLIQKTMLHRNF